MIDMADWREELRGECWKLRYASVNLTVFYHHRTETFSGHAYLNDGNQFTGHDVATFAEAARIAMAWAARKQVVA